MSFFSRYFPFFRHNHTECPPVSPNPLLRLTIPNGQTGDKNVYVMSDLHGQYVAFLRMLWKIRFHPERDLLILAGDLIDCGPDSCSMLEYTRMESSVLVLRGNHEQDLINAWSSFGLRADPVLFARLKERRGKDAPEEYVSWLSSLPSCCSLTLGERRFLIAHAAPPSPTPQEAPDWERCLYGGEKDFYQEACRWDGTVLIAGHTPTIHFSGRAQIWKSPDGLRQVIDCGASCPECGGRLGCLRLNDMAEFYTEI